ncbi:MAG: hypothetical protein VX789_05515 [Candidatus Neomarinimicrobiota bacterium]|nr:hypothetical protein [Candidatus Neomarinimicrobiota bacterium]
MKYTIQISLTVFLIMMAGCQNTSTESVGLSDAELIQAIIDADKISVGIDGLPSNSKTIVEEDYNEYDGIDTKKAYGLGYEVSMDGKGHKMGHRCEVYFNLEGRKLDPNAKRGDKSDWDRDDDKGDWKCFDLVLPVTYVMPDGSTITVNSNDEDDWVQLKAWYDANPNSEEKPALQYPVDISFETRDGSITITVINDEDMRNAYLRCGGRDDDDRECFELILPVSFVMPDGSTIIVENDSGWVDLRSWYEANPDTEGRPELQYPVDIVFDDETVTINNAEEMNIVKRECWEYEDEGRECFGLVYPVTFIMPDGSNIVVATDDENGWQEVKDWYDANPESEDRPTLQYPVDIIYRTIDGNSTVTINNEEEMEAAKDECRENDD